MSASSEPQAQASTLRAWPLWTVALLTALWLGWTTGWRHLAVPDEGRYAGVAWEMIRSGDWLTPTLNGLPFFHKPPLFYWLTAVSIEAFGLHPWAGRLASVLGAWMGAMALYLLLRRWSSERHARLSLLALLTMPYWFGGAQYANLDMLVAGCISATVAMGAHAALLFEARLPHRRAVWATWALAGLGLLAKGLIGFVLPGGVIGLWLLARGRWRSLLALLSVVGVLAFALVAAPWFVAMQLRYPDFFHYFFVYQHFQRFTETGFNNMHPWWWYLPVIFALTLPWIPLGLWLRWRGRDASVAIGSPAVGTRPSMAKAASTASTASAATTPAVLGLLAAWGGVVLLFFSLPASKLAGYVLPVIPALAGGLAWWGVRWLPSVGAPSGLPVAWSRTVAGAAVLSLVLIGVVRHYDNRAAHPLVPALKQALQGDARLVFVESFAYDLPYLIGQKEPVPLFTDWDDPLIPKRDNDLKELFDAAAFNPERGKLLLQPRSAWDLALCQHERTVVVGRADVVKQYRQLAETPPVARSARWNLWVLDRDTLRQRGLACTPLAQRGLAAL
jgi:4-amino-4-deoxy-L-arabinose transferase-like glycosyltransferase